MEVSIFNDTFATAYKKNGSVAQLNRASDYGSEGSGFESQRSHFFSIVISKFGSVAQLNRASDYGSEGSGFESQRSHINRRSFMKDFSLFNSIKSISLISNYAKPFLLQNIHFCNSTNNVIMFIEHLNVNFSKPTHGVNFDKRKL